MSCTMLKVYLLVYLFMPCNDRCDDDDGPPSASTTVGAFRHSPGGQQLFLKIVHNVSCFCFIPCVSCLEKKNTFQCWNWIV